MKDLDNNVIFYIAQYRNIFKKIFIIYFLCILCIAFLFYKVATRPDIQYYASGESGRLKVLNGYSESQASGYIEKYKNNEQQ